MGLFFTVHFLTKYSKTIFTPKIPFDVQFLTKWLKIILYSLGPFCCQFLSRDLKSSSKKGFMMNFIVKSIDIFFRWVCCLKKVPKPTEAVTRVVKLNPDIIVVSVTGLHTLQHQHILSTSSINYSRSTSTYLLPFSFPKFQSWLALLKSVWKYYTNFRFNFFSIPFFYPNLCFIFFRFRRC